MSGRISRAQNTPFNAAEGLRFTLRCDEVRPLLARDLKSSTEISRRQYVDQLSFSFVCSFFFHFSCVH